MNEFQGIQSFLSLFKRSNKDENKICSETPKKLLNEISNKNRENTPITQHIKKSFLYKNMAEKHQNKVEFLKTNTKLKIKNSQDEALNILNVNDFNSDNKNNVFLSEVKINSISKKISPSRNVNSSYQFKHKKLNKSEAEYRQNVFIPTLDNLSVNNIVLRNYEPNPENNFNTPVKPNMSKRKLEEFEKTAKLLKRQMDEEFLEKISMPVNEKFLNKTANNFNKNKGLYKIKAGSRLKNELNYFKSFDDFYEKETVNNFTGKQSKGMQVTLESNRFNQEINNKKSIVTKYEPGVDLSNPFNSHLVRMLKIAKKYNQIYSPNKKVYDPHLKSLMSKFKNKFVTKFDSERKAEVAKPKIIQHSRVFSENINLEQLIENLNQNEDQLEEIHVNSLGTYESFLKDEDIKISNLKEYKKFQKNNKKLLSPGSTNKHSGLTSSTTKYVSGLPDSGKSISIRNDEENQKYRPTNKFKTFLKSKHDQDRTNVTKLTKKSFNL